MTIVEHRVPSDVDNYSAQDFDPLREFAGQWNTRLASYYWSWLNHMFARWECIKGRLIGSPAESLGNVWGESKLQRLLAEQAEAAGYYVLGTLNLGLDPDTWLQPDISVLHRLPSRQPRTFVPADYFAMPIEFVSPSSRKRDLEEKPELLAAAGVPFYMTIEINDEQRTIVIQQSKLFGESYKLISSASTGGTLTMTEPFEARFAVNELLTPDK